MNVLVTGGCGYIGSHTCLALQAAGMNPLVVDNLGNSKRSVLTRIAAISGQEPAFYQGDIRDPALLDPSNFFLYYYLEYIDIIKIL